MYKSLTEFVQFLESQGELLRIKEYVSPDYEIAEITDRISKQQGEERLCYLRIQELNFRS